MTVYVVTMYRWGDQESHSYPIGVFVDKERAEHYGKEEKAYRGGKYEPKVEEFSINEEINSPKLLKVKT